MTTPAPPADPPSVGGPTDPTHQALAIVRAMLNPRDPLSARELQADLVKVEALLSSAVARTVGGPTDPTGP